MQIINQLQDSLPSDFQIKKLIDELWPICRSITGNGFSRSIELLKKIIPLNLNQVSSGTQVFDWVIPDEWNINDAYVLDPSGKKIIDFKQNNLHVVNYSVPVDKYITLSELQEHLHSREDLPEAIPYITSYYQKRWGFCLDHNLRKSLIDGTYKVYIDSTLKPGKLQYGEALLASTCGSTEEVLLSSYLCHPSMGNNELSGPICFTYLYRIMASLDSRKYNYRFYIGPETIGAISYLARVGEHLKKNCIAGLVLTCCGTPGKFTYKKSRKGNTIIDQLSENILGHYCKNKMYNLEILDFFPMGSDERQYCSPGFDLPIGSIMRTMYGGYPEYHTSLDNKEFITTKSIIETIEAYSQVLLSLEFNDKYKNQIMNCEPQLGKRGLYPTLGKSDTKHYQNQKIKYINYILNYSDGHNDLLDIAKKANTTVLDLYPICLELEKANVISKI